MKNSPKNNFFLQNSPLQRVLVLFVALAVVVLSFLTVFQGVLGLVTKDYTVLGDPYYTKHIPALDRAPAIVIITLVAFAAANISALMDLFNKQKK